VKAGTIDRVLNIPGERPNKRMLIETFVSLVFVEIE